MAKSTFSDSGYISEPKNITTHNTMMFGDRVHKIHKVVVHSFLMGDVEDPELYAAEPLLKWQKSEAGQWIMDRAIESPEWHRQLDHSIYGYRFVIVAKLKDRDFTFWQLKWGLTN